MFFYIWEKTNTTKICKREPALYPIRLIPLRDKRYGGSTFGFNSQCLLFFFILFISQTKFDSHCVTHVLMSTPTTCQVYIGLADGIDGCELVTDVYLKPSYILLLLLCYDLYFPIPCHLQRTFILICFFTFFKLFCFCWRLFCPFFLRMLRFALLW